MAEKPLTEEEWLDKHPINEEQILKQNNLMYAGLIGIGVVLVQPFLTAAPSSVAARICVLAFSVAIPLLGFLLLLNQLEVSNRRGIRSPAVDIVKGLAILIAGAGVVAAFWHIDWLAGVGVLISGLVGMTLHSFGYIRVQPEGKIRKRLRLPGRPR